MKRGGGARELLIKDHESSEVGSWKDKETKSNDLSIFTMIPEKLIFIPATAAAIRRRMDGRGSRGSRLRKRMAEIVVATRRRATN